MKKRKPENSCHCRFFLTMFLTLTLTLPGCIDEQNLNTCPVDVTLTFDNEENGTDRFAQNIQTVDAYLFDADGVYLFTQRAASELDHFHGMHLSLTPGDYRVVCWANLSNRSGLPNFVPGVTTIDECYVQIVSTATGDALYFAPKGNGSRATNSTGSGDNTLHVSSQENTTKHMSFVRGARVINVYIQGIEHTQNGAPGAPSVDATNLWSKYSFAFEPQSDKTTLTQQAAPTTTPDGEMYLTTFYSGLGEITPDMEIVVYNALGREVYRLNLATYLSENNVTDTDDIRIAFDFDDTFSLGVTVTIPDWESVDVGGSLI